jgi:hypothetical protein
MAHLPIWNLHCEKEIYKEKIGPKCAKLGLRAGHKQLGQLLRSERYLDFENED